MPSLAQDSLSFTERMDIWNISLMPMMRMTARGMPTRHLSYMGSMAAYIKCAQATVVPSFSRLILQRVSGISC